MYFILDGDSEATAMWPRYEKSEECYIVDLSSFGLRRRLCILA